jgi:hypothetical protein
VTFRKVTTEANKDVYRYHCFRSLTRRKRWGMCQTDVLLIELECRYCKISFLMCRECYRGHVYCSTTCRDEAQAISHRISQKKYRRTEKGKKSHRENEKKRRMGRVKKTVADDSTRQVLFRLLKFTYIPNQRPRCGFCGIYGKIVGAFPRRRP